MLETLKNKLQIIIDRYERLNLDTESYRALVKMVNDDDWLRNRANIMSKIINSENIFNIAKEINLQKNDIRLDEAFAELDTARNLITSNFFGEYKTVTYQPRLKDKRWPDILAENDQGITPIEVKLLTPSGLSETKFFQKFIDKINKDAMPQLDSYYATDPFTRGYIFVWSYAPVPLQKIEYDKLRIWVDDKVRTPEYDVILICNFYKIGTWDFPIIGKTRQTRAQ